MSNQIEFQLPNDLWKPAEPEAGQIFNALRVGEFQYFCPNISADMAELQPDASLEDAVAAVGQRLQAVDASAHVVKRSVDEESGAALQQVDLEVQVAPQVRRAITQAQAFTVLEDQNSDKRVLLCTMLTAESDTLDEYLPDFQAFLESVEIPGAEAP